MEKQKNTVMTTPELWFSDVRGIYIPRDFAEFLNGNDKIEHNIPQEDIEILLDVDHDFYWDVWEGVLESKFTVKDTGQVLELYQDGDLWVLPEGALDKFYSFEKLDCGAVELLGFFGQWLETVVTLEELEEHRDRFHDENDYQIAIELLNEE